MNRALRILFGITSCALLLALASSSALAQVAVVKRNVNLRVDPSTWQEPVRLLTPPEEMSVLDNLHQVNGYYHVITAQNEEGWVWSPNVTVDPNRTLSVHVEPIVYHGCPPEGNAIPQAVKDLNVLKNRYKPPQPADVDANITLNAMLAPGDDEQRWQSGQAADLTGFVFDVKVGGVETSNCRATTKEFRDTHIELVLSSTDSGPTRRVIVEVTPRWRDAEAQHGTDWSTDTLKTTIKGHTVKVRGWLLFDQEHADESENTKPGRAGQLAWNRVGGPSDHEHRGGSVRGSRASADASVAARLLSFPGIHLRLAERRCEEGKKNKSVLSWDLPYEMIVVAVL